MLSQASAHAKRSHLGHWRLFASAAVLVAGATA